MAISTNGTIITRLAGSLYGEYLSNASYTELNTTSASTVAANMLSNDFAGKTDAQIATTVLTNLGLTTVAGLDNWVAAQLTAAGSTAAAKGAKLVSMLNDYAMMTADATYGASATSFNSKVAASLVLSQTTGNAGGSFATVGTVAANGGTFNLTTGADVAGTTSAANGTLSSNFRFTDGNETVTAELGTLSSSDTLIDRSSTDADVMNISLAASPSAFTASKVETINVDFMAGSPVLDISAVTNTNTYGVSGAVAGGIGELNAQLAQPTFSLSNYGRVFTINAEQLSGTATDATAETINVSVSGATYGSTAATRTGVTLTADDGTGTLETLNIASTGAAQNTYTLDAGLNVTLSTVNLTGDAAQTVRVSADDISGITVVATAATADVNVRINREGKGTTGTNVVGFSGVDNVIIADDAATPAAALVLTGVASAQKITLADDMASSSVITVVGTSVGVNAASLTIVLDNDTAERDLDIAGTLTIDNVTALNLQSSGFVTSATDGTSENALTLDGDFSTITITGDTSVDLTLDIDPAGSTELTARAVTVTAADMTGTARADIAATSAETTVTFNITGTANDDTLTANNSGNTLTGAAGNDTLTGGSRNDVISGGDGNDTVFASAGTDTVTLGAGVDTITFGEADVAAVAQVNTITITDGTTGNNIWAAGDLITVTINSIAAVYEVTPTDVAGVEAASGIGDVDDDAIAISIARFINNTFGATVTAAVVDDTLDNTLTVTADSAGTSFTIAVTDSDGTATATVADTTTNVAAVSVDTRVSDFTSGTGGDVITFDLSEMNGVALIDNLVDGAGDIADTDDVVLLDFTNDAALGATDVADTVNIVKVAYTTAINSSDNMLAGLDITLNANTKGTSTDGLLVIFYDADDGVARIGIVKDSTAEDVFDETSSTFNEIAAITLTGVQYTALTAANFDFVA